jgi:hypothetical protein
MPGEIVYSGLQSAALAAGKIGYNDHIVIAVILQVDD